MNKSNKNFTDVELILRRLKDELDLKTDKELAKALDYKSVSSISNWKSRGKDSIDWNRIMDKHPSLNVNYVKSGRATSQEVVNADEVDLPKGGLSRNQMKELLGQIESIVKIMKDSL